MTARPPKWQWPQVTDERFRPDDEIYERPDGQYRVVRRVGAPGWNLLVRSDKLASGWSLAAENKPSLREAQDQASIHEWADRQAANAPPIGPETRRKLAGLLSVDEDAIPGPPGSE